MRDLAIAAFLASCVLAGSPARADVTVCNEFLTTVHVAFANQENGSYRATGWWAVEKDACQTVDFTAQGDTFFYAADSDSYKSGRDTKHDHWGNKVKLYVGRNKFDFTGAEKPRRGAKAEMFSSASSQLQDPAITLHFKSGGTSIEFKKK